MDILKYTIKIPNDKKNTCVARVLSASCYIVSGFGGLWALSRPAIGRNRRPKGALSKWPLWVVGASARGDWQTIGAINRRHKKCTVIGCHIMSASA